jgi:hypothetical protein
LNERLTTAQQIHKCLNDPFIKLYLHFLNWMLPKFTTLNMYFQSEKVIILNMNEKIRGTYRDMLLCYM